MILLVILFEDDPTQFTVFPSMLLIVTVFGLGINISSAINSFVKATIRENGLPFALKASEDPYMYSEENMKYLRKSIHQIETGKCQIHELKESD